MPEETFDVIVVGAGAAGAPLAARLAEGGLRVLVLEAGADPLDPLGMAGADRPLADDYLVPAFHAFASEHAGMSRDFWVRHYDDAARQQRDWRYDEVRDGVLYPRVRALGGCTAHHAMITVRPNDADWNHIAETMGDPSWRASQMQGYWERVERCRTRWFPWRWLARADRLESSRPWLARLDDHRTCTAAEDVGRSRDAARSVRRSACRSGQPPRLSPRLGRRSAGSERTADLERERVRYQAAAAFHTAPCAQRRARAAAGRPKLPTRPR